MATRSNQINHPPTDQPALVGLGTVGLANPVPRRRLRRGPVRTTQQCHPKASCKQHWRRCRSTNRCSVQTRHVAPICRVLGCQTVPIEQRVLPTPGTAVTMIARKVSCSIAHLFGLAFAVFNEFAVGWDPVVFPEECCPVWVCQNTSLHVG